jgi:hypothetical protein
VTLADTAGLLSATTNAVGGGGTISSNAGHTSLTITGTLAQVDSDLTTLTEQATAADSIVVNASDNRGGTAPAQTIAVSVNAPPVISAPASALVQQGVATAVTGVSVSDTDAGSANETITVTLADTAGLLSATTNAVGGGGTISNAGTTSLTITGTLAQVNADLTTLTEQATAADSIVVNASDNRGGTAPAQTIAVSVNAPPAITAPASALVQQGVATAVNGVSVSDTDAGSANETITVTLADTVGLLSATTNAVGGGGTISSNAGHTSLTVTGTLSQVQADLTTLTEEATAADSIVVNASDNRGGTAPAQTIAVSVNAPPAITAPASALVQQGVTTAVTGVSVSDTDAVSASETLTVTLADTAGLLSATTNAVSGGGTISNAGTAAMTITGTLAQVNADLTTLTDRTNTVASDSIVVNASDGRGGTAPAQSITVNVNAPPAISAPASALVQQNQASPVAGISIADADAASANETLTVTLIDSNGLLSATGAGTITGSGTKSLTIAGTLVQVNADLATLTDQATAADSIVVNASDNRGGTAPAQTITVNIAGQGDRPPVIQSSDKLQQPKSFVETPHDSESLQARQGEIRFTDLDIGDRPTGSIDSQTVTFKDDQGNVRTLGAKDIALLKAAFGISPASGNTNNGVINWNFTIKDSDLDRLQSQAGVLTLTSVVKVDDHHGGSDTATIIITIVGNNHRPVISNGPESATVSEQPNAAASVELKATGTLQFIDQDPTATHSITVRPRDSAGNSDDYIGNLHVTLVSDSTGGQTGIVSWTFDVRNGALQHLPAGRTVTQVYHITVDDGHGGKATETVTIRLAGPPASRTDEACATQQRTALANLQEGDEQSATARTDIDILAKFSDFDLSPDTPSGSANWHPDFLADYRATPATSNGNKPLTITLT